MQTIEDQILNFISEELGLAGIEIPLDSSLAQDLGMDGDDAIEFFQSFGKKFDLDLQELWTNWRYHFRSEGLLFFPSFRRQVPITVQDLVESAKAGRWVLTDSAESTT